MNAKERESYKKLLIERKMMLVGDVSHLRDESLSKSRQDASGDLSSMPVHMADIGTENYDQEFAIGLVESEEEELREIDGALQRVETKDYGVCEECTKQIQKTRLKAIPYARLCIACKTQEETQSGEED